MTTLITHVIDDATTLELTLGTGNVATHSLLQGPRMGRLVSLVQEFLAQVAREEQGRPGK